MSTGLLADASLRVLKALVVDDDAFRHAVAHMLRELDWAADAVESAEVAVGKIQAEQYDLVVIDLGLPRMSGIECIAYLQAIQPDLPIIVISGHGFLLRELSQSGLSVRAAFEKPLVGPSRDKFEKVVHGVEARVQGPALGARDAAPSQRQGPGSFASDGLVALFLEGVMFRGVDEEVRAIYRSAAPDWLGPSELDEVEVQARIAEVIDTRWRRFLVTVANRLRLGGHGVARLSRDGVFGDIVARELAKRLPVGPYLIAPFLDQLHRDLLVEVSREPFRGSWGTVEVSNGGLTLRLSDTPQAGDDDEQA